MHQYLTDQQRSILLAGNHSQAESLLADFLSDKNIELAEMGALALDFFQSARYNLAAMVFAKWTEREPSNPEPWTNLGYCLLKQNKLEDAQALAEYALELSPNYSPAIENLCDIFLQCGQHEKQLEVARKGAKLQPNSCVAQNNLGTALWHCGFIEDAKQAFLESLRLDSQYFEAKLNLGKMMSDEGDHLAATAEFEELLKIEQLANQTREVVEFYLGFEYLNAGNLQHGWQLYERGFSSSVPPLLARNPKRTFKMPRWAGQALQKNQILLVWREQGIGDELRFLALLPLLNISQKQLVIETDPRLVSSLQRSFPQALVREQQIEKSALLLSHEGYQIPAGSLPGLFMSQPSQLPKLHGYLQASPWQVNRFAQKLSAQDGTIKVGICWRSHKLNAVRNKKYSALKEWKALLGLPNVCFVSLQYGEAEQEIVEIEKELGISIVRWPDVDLKDDLEAVLGLMHNLDYIVSTSTAVVPLAGALGRPTIFLGHATWVLLGQTNAYPWYASVKPILVPRSATVSSGIQAVVDRLQPLL